MKFLFYLIEFSKNFTRFSARLVQVTLFPLTACCASMCRFEKQDGVVLMATTRNLKQIDDALQRPGRMDRVFHLQRLTQSEREKILQIAAKESMDEELIDYVDWKKVIYIHPSFVRNMASVCTEISYDA